MQVCAECKFFAYRKTHDEIGECRIRPIQVIVVPSQFGVQVRGTWPPTDPNSCCGEGQPREPKIPIHIDSNKGPEMNNAKRNAIVI